MFTSYSGATTLTLLIHLYANYTRILVTDLTENDRKLQEIYNIDEPLESLYTRLNECVNYASVEGGPITEGQVVLTAYCLVAETRQC